MECENFEKELARLLHDNLDQPSRIELETHLARCARCQNLRGAFQRLDALLAEERSRVVVGEEDRIRLLRKARERLKQSRKAQCYMLFAGVLGLLAASLVWTHPEIKPFFYWVMGGSMLAVAVCSLAGVWEVRYRRRKWERKLVSSPVDFVDILAQLQKDVRRQLHASSIIMWTFVITLPVVIGLTGFVVYVGSDLVWWLGNEPLTKDVPGVSGFIARVIVLQLIVLSIPIVWVYVLIRNLRWRSRFRRELVELTASTEKPG